MFSGTGSSVTGQVELPPRPYSGRTPAAQKLCPVWWDAVCSGPHIGGCWLSFQRARVHIEMLEAGPQAAGCHHGDRVDPAGLGGCGWGLHNFRKPLFGYFSFQGCCIFHLMEKKVNPAPKV